MSSLYAMMKKPNVNAAICLVMLDINQQDIPRLRNMWLTDNGEQIILLTRTGGNNRADYKDEISGLRCNSNYVSDEDDPADSTYARFIFDTPKKYKEDCIIIAEAILAVGVGAETNTLTHMLEYLGKEPPPRQELTEDLSAGLLRACDAHHRISTSLLEAKEKQDG